MSIVIDFLTVVFFFSAISATGSNAFQSLIAMGLVGLMVIRDKGKLALDSSTKWMFLFLATVTVEIMLSGNNPTTYVLSRFLFFVPVMISLYYRRKHEGTKVLWIVLIVWGMVSLWAVYLMSSGIMNVRSVVMRLESQIPFSGGGYALAVGSAVLAVYMFDMLIWGKVKKILAIPFIILLCAVVVLTQSTTTIVALACGIIASVILRITMVSRLRNLTRRQVISLMIIFVICVVLYLLKDKIGDLIISLAYGKNDILSRRLVEFGTILSDNTEVMIDTSDSDGRFRRLFRSLNLFFDHPIFGVTIITGTDHFAQAAYGVGSHGELFDALARFGLFAGIPYLALFFCGLAGPRKYQRYDSGFGYLVTFVILFIFNPCLYMSLNTVVFFIIPMLTMVINTESAGDRCNADFYNTGNLPQQ